jgi:hypothetical protein
VRVALDGDEAGRNGIYGDAEVGLTQLSQLPLYDEGVVLEADRSTGSRSAQRLARELAAVLSDTGEP